jgi:hypothetical protein
MKFELGRRDRLVTWRKPDGVLFEHVQTHTDRLPAWPRAFAPGRRNEAQAF